MLEKPQKATMQLRRAGHEDGRTSLLVAAMVVFEVLAASAADKMTGTARIIDGDTIAVARTMVWLSGVDAPALAQGCSGGPKALNRCGEVVADANAAVTRSIPDTRHDAVSKRPRH